MDQSTSGDFLRTTSLWAQKANARNSEPDTDPDLQPKRLAYLPETNVIAAVYTDRTVRIWDTGTRKLLWEMPFGVTVHGLAFSPDGTRLATACEDGVIRLWDTASWTEVAELRGHTAYVYAVAFSPDGTKLASASGDFTVRIWEAAAMRAADEPAEAK